MKNDLEQYILSLELTSENTVLFVNPAAIDLSALAQIKTANGVRVQIIPVIPLPGQTIADAITARTA